MKRGGGGGGSGTKRHIIINRKRQQQQQSSVGRNLIIAPPPLPLPSTDLVELSSSEKTAKKEKVRSLSAVSKALSSSSSMGFHLSHSPKSSLISHNNFNLPTNKKVFSESNGVDHASVPRKIRSAMKKRGRESILTDSENVNHKIIDGGGRGIESPQKDDDDSIKKKKKKKKKPKKLQGSHDWSTRQVVNGPITKDEEEVAETLYALAGMFPNNHSNANATHSPLDYCESLPNNNNNNSPVLLDQEESTNATFQQVSGAIEEDVNIICESSPKGAVKISSLSQTPGLVEHSGFPGSAQFLVAATTHSNAPKMNLQAVPMMIRRSENDGKLPLHDSELCLEMGLNVSTQSQVSHIGRQQPDAELETAGGIDCQQMVKYQKENEGSALWPGLTPRASAEKSASCLQSSAAKAPHWLSAAISASKQDLMESCSSAGKITGVVHKKSRKRCATHVHISQLIQSLEVPKAQVAKEPGHSECNQIRVHQGSKCGVQKDAQNPNGARNGNSSAVGTVHPAGMSNFPETKNGILQQQYQYLDTSQSQVPSTPGVYGPQKQSFNFLSLSASGNGLKVDTCFNKGGSRLEAFSKSQIHYFQSLQQQHGLIPIPMPQSHYASTSYLDQLSAAGPQGRLQQPHYYGTPLCGTSYGSTASYKQQQQQQQSFWASQLATQGGAAMNVVRTQYPNWQSGRNDTSSAVSPCAQVMLPHSLGSNITSISEQQSFTLASSLPPSRTNGLDIHVCEENSRGRFRGSGSGTSSLQLLCDERI